MSLKHLARVLSKVEDFKEPKIDLEQYLTDSGVAAELLWSMNMRGNIEGKTILDLGAGTGILGIGALLLGAKRVVFLEKDEVALKILKDNLALIGEEYELPDFEVVLGDVSSSSGSFDLVIMNPPFGTKTKHMDTLFLEKAISLSNKILSIHKSSTKEYVLDFFNVNNFEVVEVFDFDYVLKKTFTHHDASKKIIDVSGFFAIKMGG